MSDEKPSWRQDDEEEEEEEIDDTVNVTLKSSSNTTDLSAGVHPTERCCPLRH
jgi:hypothetical protein